MPSVPNVATRAAGTSLLLALCSVAPAPVAAQPARPVFTDGQAQVVGAFADSTQWIRERLWVETEFDSDGDGRRDRVHVGVTRQVQTRTEGLKVPVVYESSPYFAGTSGPRQFLWNVRRELGVTEPPRQHQPAIPFRGDRTRISNSQVNTWVPRGFAVVHSEAPGTGLSQGCPTVGDDPEVLAPKAVIDWLNGRAKGFTSPDGNTEVKADWTTGKVGMTGTSYNGTIPLAAATTGVEGLTAIIPIAPNTSYYHYYRSNGLVRHPGGWLGEDIDFLYDFVHSGDPARRARCNATWRDSVFARGMDRATGDLNEFWRKRDLLPRLGNVKAAVLMAHAFNDWNVVPEHSVRITQALKARGGVPLQMYFHQGGHGGAPPLVLMNRWFTRYLYDVDNGVERDPRAWIVREGAEREKPTPYADYPNPAAAAVELHLTKGGTETGGVSLSPVATQGTETLVDNVSFSGAVLAQAEWTNHRLLYATPVLAESVHVSGVPRITIRLAASQAAANLSVWLVELPYTTRRLPEESIISRGWADPQNHRSIERGEPLAPGEFRTLTFDLQPEDQVIPAGKRIGVMIMSSDRDFTLWPKPGTTLTVDLDATIVSLPVVGGRERLRRALSLAQ